MYDFPIWCEFHEVSTIVCAQLFVIITEKRFSVSLRDTPEYPKVCRMVNIFFIIEKSCNIIS